MVLNPRATSKAKQWIAEDYESVIFQYENNNETSVIAEEYRTNLKYNEDLKNFLQPILQQKGAEKVKKYRKKMKIYAEVLGLNLTPKEKNVNKEKEQRIRNNAEQKKEKENLKQ